MRQLTGLDASFLYLETANAPMHIAGLSIYDPSTAPGGAVRIHDIITNTHERLLELPVMTQRLVTVPLSLDHPYWVTEGAYDPEFHIRHLALPRPGDWRQLCMLISRLHSRPLDRGRPLWELYIIEGLDNVEGVPKGSFATFHKTHHAAIDGTSGMEMTAAIHDLTADYERAPRAATINVDNEPSAMEMLLRAQFNAIRKPFHLINVARNTAPRLANAIAGLSRGRLSRVKEVPRTRFNTNVSPHRVFDAINVPLDVVKQIKNAVPGATVNDAAIAIVGGALRKYLQAHNELPQQSLAAMTPTNVRSDDDSVGGNIIASMTVQLRSDIEDPLERLRAVHESSRKAKELTHAIGAKTMTDYSYFIPPTLTSQAIRLINRWGLMNRIKPLFNCVITNVPGPPIALYNTGARMVANYGTGPVMDGVGLFHVVSSYCGQFVISATSCRRMMPDPFFYRQCLRESVEELQAATTAAPTAATTSKVPTRSPAKSPAKKRKRSATQVTRRRSKPKHAA